MLNLKTGENRGCSPDEGTSPDLAARVWHNGAVVAETYKAQDSAPSEWFALHHLTGLSGDEKIAIEVREAEPGFPFFLGLGTWWIPCDVDPGPGTWLNVSLDGTRAFSSTGDSQHAASVSGYIGAGPHPSGVTLTTQNRTKTSITFAWSVDPADPGGVSQTLHFSGRGAIPLSSTARSATMDGLSEGYGYSARLVRQSDPYLASVAPMAFFTLPRAPTLRATAVDGGADVQVDVGSTYVETVEVHVGANASYAPSPATLQQTARPFAGRADVRLRDMPPGVPAYLRAISIDEEGGRSDPSSAVMVIPTTPPPPPTPLANVTPETQSDTAGVRVAWPGADLAPFARLELLVSNASGAARVAATLPGDAKDVVLSDLVPNVTYTVAVRGVRADGGVDLSRNASATWARGNTLPKLDLATPARAAVGQRVTARASAEDAENDLIALRIDWGDGTTSDVTNASATHAYEATGTYEVVLRGRDPYAGEAHLTRPLVIDANQPPVVRLTLSAAALEVGTVLLADVAGSSDPEGDPMVFEVSWGDGTSDAGEGNLVHQYDAPGRYSLVAVATSRGVTSAPAFAHVEVSAPPPLRPTPSPAALSRGEAVPATVPVAQSDSEPAMTEEASIEPSSPAPPLAPSPAPVPAPPAWLALAGAALLLRRRLTSARTAP